MKSNLQIRHFNAWVISHIISYILKKLHYVPLSLRAVLSTSLLVLLQFSFFASPQAKYDFLPVAVDSDRNCKFQRFCPARSDYNYIAHGERF